MFKLFYYANIVNPDLLFTDDNLGPCVEFIKNNKLCPQQCVIVTPNNRRVTFNSDNEMVFSNFVA